MTGDALESNSGRFFGVVNGFVPLLSSFSRDARARGWCWRIKKGIAQPLSLKMGTKKGKGFPYQSEAPLPVIFCTTIVVATYPVKARLPLFNRGFSSSLDPPRSLKKARLTLYQTE